MGKLRKKIEAAKKRIAAKKELLKALFQDAETRLSTQSAERPQSDAETRRGARPVNPVNLRGLRVENGKRD